MHSSRNVGLGLRNGALLAASVFALALAGCGGGGHHGGAFGQAYVENQDVYVTEYFEIAPSGTGAWSGDVLPYDLFPGDDAYIGSYFEDFYDANAYQSDGSIFEFDGVPIYAYEPTTFLITF